MLNGVEHVKVYGSNAEYRPEAGYRVFIVTSLNRFDGVGLSPCCGAHPPTGTL
jgi:hypothetical protein